MPVVELIESFSTFAREQVARRGESVTIDDVFDEWRMQQAPNEDWLAIRQSLDDMERGERGQDFEDFAAEFRRRNLTY